MATTYETDEGNPQNVKDEIMSNVHEGIVEVPQASNGTTTAASSEPITEEDPAAAPQELPEKKPEIEPENIPKESPGIDPGTERGDDEDEIREPPIKQPSIIMAAE